MRLKVLLLSLFIFLYINVAHAGEDNASAESNWETEGYKKFAPEFNTDKYKSKTYVIAVGTPDKLQDVKAVDVMRAIKDGKEIRFKFVNIQGKLSLHKFTDDQEDSSQPSRFEIKKPVYFINTTFLEEASFFGGIEELRNSQMYAESWKIITENILRDMKRISVIFTGNACFRDSTFSKGALFHGAEFAKKADFSGAKFSEAEFTFGELGKGASFFKTTFSEEADFSDTEFTGEANFQRTKFLGKTDFTTANFTKALFTFANFSQVKNEVSFKGTRFEKMANFSYATFRNVSFNSTRNEKPTYIPSNSQFISDLDNGRVSEGLVKAFEENEMPISQEVNVSKVGDENQWILTDKKEKHTYTVFKGNPLSDSGKEEILEVYERMSTIKLFNLVGCEYEKMDIDPQSIISYEFDNPAFYRLIKNQQNFGRSDETVYLAMKLYQRSKKNIVARAIEKVLFDWTTQYGTAKFPPWGLIIYAMSCVSIFTIIYLFNRDFLVFVKADGTIDKTMKRPNPLEVFWFSLNTFIPMIVLFNARNWQPKYGAKFCAIHYSTLASIELILGWAMIPSLLGYFKVPL